VHSAMQMSFQGLLESDGTNLRWVIVRVPFDPVAVWPVRSRLRVKGTIRSNKNAEGFPFRTSLFATREGSYLLLVNRQMQKGARVVPGGLAEIVLEPDMEERSAATPPELAKLLKADRSVEKWHEQLNYSIRKYIADSIRKPKSADTRIRQAEQWMERMMLAMEGEQEAPPILQAAFRRQPQARVGWEALTPIQRRSHLLGIFYCQSPEARAKRAEKAVADAVLAAIRSAGSKNAANAKE
jgi:uncharacterized protein YdeI (YjbR/CyaY-like superfamily)